MFYIFMNFTFNIRLLRWWYKVNCLPEWCRERLQSTAWGPPLSYVVDTEAGNCRYAVGLSSRTSLFSDFLKGVVSPRWSPSGEKTTQLAKKPSSLLKSLLIEWKSSSGPRPTEWNVKSEDKRRRPHLPGPGGRGSLTIFRQSDIYCLHTQNT